MLVNDLVEIIAYYTVPSVTYTLGTLDASLASRFIKPPLWRNKVLVERRGLIFNDSVVTRNDDARTYHTYYRIINRREYGDAYAGEYFLQGKVTSVLISLTDNDNKGYRETEYAVSTVDNIIVYVLGVNSHIQTDIINIPGVIIMKHLYNKWFILDERGNVYVMSDNSGPKSYKRVFGTTSIVDINDFTSRCPVFLGRDGQIYMMTSNKLGPLTDTGIVGLPSPFPAIVLFSELMRFGYGVDGAAHNSSHDIYDRYYPDTIIIGTYYTGIKLNGKGFICGRHTNSPLPIIGIWSSTILTIDGTIYELDLNGTQIMANGTKVKARYATHFFLLRRVHTVTYVRI